MDAREKATRYLALAIATAAAAGCGRINFDPLAAGATLMPTYPDAGANWLDYVVRDGAGVTDASGAPCTGSERGYTACIHGGEIREVLVPGATSCANLAASDALGAFTWTCELRAGSAVMFSTGLADGKGLTDLITASSWQPNHVTVTGAGNALSTDDDVWWTNPIQALPDNSSGSALVLDGYPQGTIFTLDTSRATAGYNIDQDKLAIVALPGAVLTAASGMDNVNYQTGKVAMPNDGAILAAGSERFLWVEGEYSGAAPPPGGYMTCITGVGVSFMRVNRMTCDGPYDGMDLTNGAQSNYASHMFTRGTSTGDDGTWVDFASTYNSFYDFTSIAHNDSGIHFDTNCGNNTLEKIRIYDSGLEGLTMLAGADHNSVDDVVIDNVQTYVVAQSLGFEGAVYVESNANAFSRMLIAGTDTTAGRYPIYIKGGSDNTFNQVTVANNVDAVHLDGASNNTFNQLAVISSANDGVDIINGGSNVLAQLVVSHSATSDLALTTTSNNRFPGNLLHDGTCSVTGGTNPGLADGTCAKLNATDTTATVGGIDASTMLVGDITSDDQANQSDSNGTAAFPATPATFDWWRFDSAYRSWAPGTNTGQWTMGTGHITDYKFTSGAALVGTSGQGVGAQAIGTVNAAFVAGASCPPAASADADDAGGAAFLLDAVEIVDPRAPGYTAAGNHDGLCNSGEACVYLPNFGVDQGQGIGGLATCVFSPSAIGVSAVTMYGYP